MLAQWVGNLILFLALLAAIWYAWETRTLRLQMIRPKLIFVTRPSLPRGSSIDMDDLAQQLDLTIKNIGEGAAINVEIEKAKIDGFEIRADPEHIPILEKGREVKLAIRPAEGSYRSDMSGTLANSTISVTLTVRYFDVRGREFRTSTAVGSGARPPFIRDLEGWIRMFTA